ncbi:MAG: SDR family NAD(P)-dependent oxidoreductase [Variovorax sp.]
MSTNKRSVVITGGASGIGLAAAQQFVGAGHRVIILDLDRERAASAAEEMRSAGGEVDVVGVDLAEPAEIEQAVDSVLALGGCDVLVNNAGIHPKINGSNAKIAEIEFQHWELVLRVNLTAPFLLAQKLVPGMVERNWGRVINVSSRAGRTFSPNAGLHYAASKAGLIGMTRQLAGEVAARGVTVNAVAPGPVTTDLSARSSPEARERLVRSVPAARFAEVREIASAVLYLAQDGASYVNGAVIDVNGGGFMG